MSIKKYFLAVLVGCLVGIRGISDDILYLVEKNGGMKWKYLSS